MSMVVDMVGLLDRRVSLAAQEPPLEEILEEDTGPSTRGSSAAQFYREAVILTAIRSSRCFSRIYVGGLVAMVLLVGTLLPLFLSVVSSEDRFGEKGGEDMFGRCFF